MPLKKTVDQKMKNSERCPLIDNMPLSLKKKKDAYVTLENNQFLLLLLFFVVVSCVPLSNFLNNFVS
jgi:hypothetical protein